LHVFTPALRANKAVLVGIQNGNVFAFPADEVRSYTTILLNNVLALDVGWEKSQYPLGHFAYHIHFSWVIEIIPLSLGKLDVLVAVVPALKRKAAFLAGE